MIHQEVNRSNGNGYYGPQVRAATQTQGNGNVRSNHKDTTLDAAKARYERGIELYHKGKVNIGPNGFFVVNGYKVDPEKVSCECQDYKKRKQPCKHFYAVSLWQKNRKKTIVEDLSPSEIESAKASVENSPATDKRTADTSTRLTCLVCAIEVLKANEEFIEMSDLLSMARRLESWVTGR